MKRLVFLAALSSVALGASADWSDNFDSYAGGSNLHGQGGWTGWDNVPGAGALADSAVAYSSPNSVNITGGSDLVQQFAGATSGKWEFTGKFFMTQNFTGTSYFIMLNQYNHGGPYNWSVQINFDAATGLATEDIRGQATVPFLKGAWNDLFIGIDLDANKKDVKINGLALASGVDWKDASGQQAIAAIDLYANNAAPVYYDDLALRLVPEPASIAGLALGAMALLRRRRK